MEVLLDVGFWIEEVGISILVLFPLIVSNTHRSDVIFSHSAMKCFSLPPTGCFDSVGWDGRVDVSGMLSFCWGNCFLFVCNASACSVVSTPVPFVLSTV